MRMQLPGDLGKAPTNSVAITPTGSSALRGSFFLSPVAISVALDSPQQSTWPPRQAAAQSSHRSTPCRIVHLGLPADLTAAVHRHRRSPGGCTSTDAVSIRALVHAGQQVLLDKVWTAEEVLRNGSQVTLQLEAAHAYGPIAYVTVLLAAEPLTTAPQPAVGSVTPDVTPAAARAAAAAAAVAGAATADRVSAAAPWQLLTRLPLLMLPAPAAAEMRALFARMQQQAGISAAAAFERYFAPLARDMAFMLEAAADGTGCSQYAALLVSQRLLAYLAAEDNPLPHCMELLRAAMSSRDTAPLPYKRQRSPPSSAAGTAAGTAAAAAAAAAAPGSPTAAYSTPVVTQPQPLQQPRKQAQQRKQEEQKVAEGEVSVVESPFWPHQQKRGLRQRSFTRPQPQAQQQQPQEQQQIQQGCRQQLLLQQDSPEQLPLKQPQQKPQLQQQTHKHEVGPPPQQHQQHQQQQQQQQHALSQPCVVVAAPAAVTWRHAVWGFGDAALEHEYGVFKAGHMLGADIAFLAVKLFKVGLCVDCVFAVIDRQKLLFFWVWSRSKAVQGEALCGLLCLLTQQPMHRA